MSIQHSEMHRTGRVKMMKTYPIFTHPVFSPVAQEGNFCHQGSLHLVLSTLVKEQFTFCFEYFSWQPSL